MNWLLMCTFISCLFCLSALQASAVDGESVYEQTFNEGAQSWNITYKSENGETNELPTSCRAGAISHAGRAGSGSLLIENNGIEEQNIVIARYDLGLLQQNYEYVFTAWIKADKAAAATLQIAAFADGSPNDIQKDYLPIPEKGSFEWKAVSVSFKPRKPGLTHFRIAVALSGNGTLWVDDVKVLKGEAVSAFELPGIVKAQGRMDCIALSDGSAPVIQFPIPQSYSTQVPLTFRLGTTPTDALADSRIFEDLANNYIAEVKLRALKKSEVVTIDWSSLVLCAPSHFDNIPKTSPFPATWPKEAQEWLESSWCVQSSNAEFERIATDLTHGTNDVVEVIRRAVKKAGDISSQQISNPSGVRAPDLTALTALKYQGSCTSAANLLIALLRASGIPARSLACYPIWAGPHQTHSIIEAYIPDFGWYPIESTLLKHPWPLYKQVIVSRNPVAYEERAQKRPSGLGGVPYLQLNEIQNSDTSYIHRGSLPNNKNCDHVAEAWLNFPEQTTTQSEWADLLVAAKRSWARWLRSDPSLGLGKSLQSPLKEDQIEKTPAGLIEQLSK